MSRSTDETRREFLRRLAKAAAFVPPALVTLDATRASAQKGQGAGKAAAPAQQQAPAPAQQQAAAVGGTTPAAATRGNFRLRSSDASESSEPWDPGRSAGAPPWSRPPPTTAGGND